jgi:hypothetical protein
VLAIFSQNQRNYREKSRDFEIGGGWGSKDSVVVRGRVLPDTLSGNSRAHGNSIFAERFEPLVLLYASVLRALPPDAPPASPVAPARVMIRRVFYTAAFFFRSGWSGQNAHQKNAIVTCAP